MSRRVFLRGAGAGAAGLAWTLTGCGGSSHARGAPPVRKRARRMPHRLQDVVRGPVLGPGSPGFADAAHVYNERFDTVMPRFVVRPLDADDVAAAVRWARSNDVPLRARSGGHSYAGYSTAAGGLVLDLRNLDYVRVAADGSTARIGAAAQLIDVYAALAVRGATIPAGSCPSVGIGGHALGGGMGFAGRAFGLATDNIAGAAVVTADGVSRRVDQRADADLLWALRGGGGGNFGVVTELEMRMHPAPGAATWFRISWPWSSAADVLDAWQRWAPQTVPELTSTLDLAIAEKAPLIGVSGQYLGSSGDLARLLAPVTGIAGAFVSSGEDTYLNLQLRWAGCLGDPLARCHTTGTRPDGMLPRASFIAKSDFVTRELPPAALQKLVSSFEQPSNASQRAIIFDAYGGAINELGARDTAFVHRNALFCMQYLAYDGGDQWLAGAYGAMRPFVSGTAYQNYIDPDLRDWRDAYYGANYPRLVATQRRVDPEHVFAFPQAIGT